MTALSSSPKLVKDGLVIPDVAIGAAMRTIALQYNPDTLGRTFQPQAIKESGDRSKALRLTGPPVETIKLGAKIEAMKDGAHEQLPRFTSPAQRRHRAARIRIRVRCKRLSCCSTPGRAHTKFQRADAE